MPFLSSETARRVGQRAFPGPGTIGAIAWVAAVLLLWVSMAECILLLAPLVLVLLGLRLMDDPRAGPLSCWLLRWARGLQLPAALLLVFAFGRPQGGWAAALAGPWLAVTLLLAAAGLLRILRGRRQGAGRLCQSVGLVYLSVGGAWTLLARGGACPMGLSHEIVLLTGVHFHYAGFVLPLLTGLATQTIEHKNHAEKPDSNPPVIFWRMLGGMTVAGVLFGVPLVGVGIAFSPLVEVVSALALTGACWMLTLLQCRVALQAQRPAVLCLLGISAASLAGGMGLAAVYAVGQYWAVEKLMLHWFCSHMGFIALVRVG